MTNEVTGTAVTLHLLAGAAFGPRVAESRASPLRVHAARWQELASLLEAGLPATPAVYMLTGPTQSGPALLAVRPGEAGDIRRRLLEHAQDEGKSRFHEVYVVTAVDGRLGKFDVRYMEARYHELVAGVRGVLLDVEKIPAVAACPAPERDILESLIGQSRLLLYAAGCRALDSEGLPFGSVEPEPDNTTVRLDFDIEGTLADEHELNYDGIWARGFPHRDGFVVRAGSDVRRRENSALLAPMAERRRFLRQEGALGEIPGITDRWRLMRDIIVNSELTAAKVLTGAHQSNRGIWRRLSPSTRMIVAK